jgi:aspartokinase
LKQTPHFKSQLDKLHRTVLETAEGIAMATKTGMALITVKGIGLEGTPGIVARISETLRSDKINIFGLLTISSSVIVLVEWGKRKRAGRLIKIALSQENN